MPIDGGSAAQSPANTAAELLHLWWQAVEPVRAERLLEQLLAEHAAPVIQSVIAGRLGQTSLRLPGDAEDVRQEVTLQVLAWLRHFKDTGTPPQIENFPGFVAAITHRACTQYRRQQFPMRARLKDQLRYVLQHQRGFALWETLHKVWLSGFAIWRQQNKSAVAQGHVQALRDEPAPLEARRHGPLSDLLNALFNHLGAPVEFAALVNLVAALRGVRDAPDAAPVDEAIEATAVTQVEQRRYLEMLWQEICQLPLPQRLALLLNLRDTHERGLVVLLVELRLTTLAQLAEALSLAPLEFAELWRQLPVDDTRIAELLNLTRPQVISLRRAARRTLSGRLRVALSTE